MIQAQTFVRRRQRLSEAFPEPIVLMGHTELLRNTPGHTLPFRQDSTFLYYTGCTRPSAVAILSNGAGFELFLPESHADDELWHGPSESPQELGRRLGANRIRPRAEAAARVRELVATGRFHTLPVSDPVALAELKDWTGLNLRYGAADAADGAGSEALLEEVGRQRLVKDEDELAAMRAGHLVTRAAHRRTLELTRPGTTERELAAEVQAIFLRAGFIEAYPPIITVRGEILHCPHHTNTLEAGQLLLIDAGCEGPEGYATDVTRTFPVSGRFDPFQKDVYELVLRAQEGSIEMCRPGVAWRDVHRAASLVLAEGLVDLGLLRGKSEDLLENGAVTVFFPHGLGHPLGLDVHDLRAYGARAGWNPKRKEEEPPDYSYSKVNWTLQPGMVFTVEPGIYFVPARLQRSDFRERFGAWVDFEKAEKRLRFGGIRIEDDVLITQQGCTILSTGIPRTVEEIEAYPKTSETRIS